MMQINSASSDRVDQSSAIGKGEHAIPSFSGGRVVIPELSVDGHFSGSWDLNAQCFSRLKRIGNPFG
jgi:hypothetical protein